MTWRSFTLSIPLISLIGCGYDENSTEFDGEIGSIEQALSCGQVAGTLTEGKSYYSCNKRYRLIFQNDGNLVLYKGNSALWHTSTFSRWKKLYSSGREIFRTLSQGKRAVMQQDGNLVVYGDIKYVFPDGREYQFTNKALWASRTANNQGARLMVQEDGNLVIYNTQNKPIWQTHTAGQ